MRIIKNILNITAVCFLMLCLSLCVMGADALKTRTLLKDETGRIVAVSHRGDTANYPANTLEAVMSASEKGADAVSVAVSVTKDSVPVLCEDISLGNVCDTDKPFIKDITAEEFLSERLYDSFGALTQITPVSLERALEEIGGEVYLILDITPESFDAVYEVIKKCDAFEVLSVRMKYSASEIAEISKENLDIIGIYTGNIIWNSTGHINKLSQAGMTAAEYRTKNYFNVCYGTVVGDNFSAEGKARASAAAYDAELCGKRSDSQQGWDSLVGDGFTVIETNNIKALSEYVEMCTAQEKSLAEIIKRAEKTDLSKSSNLSRDNINSAVKRGKALLEGRAKPLSDMQKAYSDIIYTLENRRISDGEEQTKGALNISAGKIAVFILTGAAILGAQVFVDKKKKAKYEGGK